MTISFPVSLPSTKTAARISFDAVSQVGVSQSPFTGVQQVYAHQGEWFEAMIELPPMMRADAEQWVAFLLSLNGREGTFLLGDPANTVPRGSWASPLISGAHAAGVKTLVIKSVDGLTWKRGDWLQLGSGSTSRLHKVVQDGSQVGSPSTGTVEIWPRTRAALADGDAITLSSPKGLFRLKENRRSWSIGEGSFYGASFSAMEAL